MQGVLGAFHHIDSTIEAIDDLRKEQFDDITVFMPTPRHEFEHALGHGPSRVRLFTLIFGLAGITFGYWIPVWISDYWPIVVGGKAVVTWVPFTILGFEVTVLVGGLMTVFAMFGLAHIPRLTTTVGYDPRFSGGHFGIWVVTDANRLDAAADLLKRHGAEEVRRER